jgi:hypothetical protein
MIGELDNPLADLGGDNKILWERSEAAGAQGGDTDTSAGSARGKISTKKVRNAPIAVRRWRP